MLTPARQRLRGLTMTSLDLTVHHLIAAKGCLAEGWTVDQIAQDLHMTADELEGWINGTR